jgi:hypothetical protein
MLDYKAMSDVFARLEVQDEARRLLARPAQVEILALGSQTAEQTGEQIATWLGSASGLVLLEVLPDRHLGRDWDCRILQDVDRPPMSRLLLISLPGHRHPNWNDWQDAAGLAWKLHVDSVAIATRFLVTKDEIARAAEDGVKLWGDEELEDLYMNGAHETPGLSIF